MNVTGSTGSHDFDETQFIKYKLGKYEITVEVTLDNKFIGITEIKVNTDFRSYHQKIASTKAFDVEEYYKDE
jgi:hypothetical protein